MTEYILNRLLKILCRADDESEGREHICYIRRRHISHPTTPLPAASTFVGFVLRGHSAYICDRNKSYHVFRNLKLLVHSCYMHTSPETLPLECRLNRQAASAIRLRSENVTVTKQFVRLFR